MIRDLVGGSTEKIRFNPRESSDLQGFMRKDYLKSPHGMRVVEHEESETEGADLGSPYINKAMRDIIKAR